MTFWHPTGAETPGQVKAEGGNRSVSYVRVAFAIEISPSNRDLAALLGYRECMEAKRLQKLIQNRTERWDLTLVRRAGILPTS